MFSFFKKKPDNTNIPEWASFFDSGEYAMFIKEIDSYFKKLKLNHKIEDGVVLVEENNLGLNNLGLVNVAQVCKQAKPKYYPEIIKEHFNSMIKASEFEKEFAKIADNFEAIKKYLGVRLYDNETVAHVGKENTIGKDFAGDIYAMIVFDFPESVVTIKPERTSAWNKTIDELFEVGIENIKAKYPLSISKESLGEISVWFVQGDHFFTPNIVFDIESRQELIGSKGSLVGVPHRHAALIYPIENLEVVKALNGLIPTIYGMNQDGPGSLSNNLFWYKDKMFIQLPYKVEENQLQFLPPEDFVKMLNELKQ